MVDATLALADVSAAWTEPGVLGPVIVVVAGMAAAIKLVYSHAAENQRQRVAEALAFAAQVQTQAAAQAAAIQALHVEHAAAMHQARAEFLAELSKRREDEREDAAQRAQDAAAVTERYHAMAGDLLKVMDSLRRNIEAKIEAKG